MSFLERPVVKFALFVALASFSVNCTGPRVSATPLSGAQW